MKHWGAIGDFSVICNTATQGDICLLDSSIDAAMNNGGATSYYDIPEGAKTLNDLIEYKEMPFWLGELFKAAYALPERATRSDNASEERELNKIIYYANRRLDRIKK